jgi:hypothetical protein
MQQSIHAYPLRHISIRVPWHDGGWNGTVCKAPRLNGACLKLPNIATKKDDLAEEAIAGQSIENLASSQHPCCITERGTFMAPFEFTREACHPYVETSANTHGHFAPTPIRHPSYSAAALPFLWMRNDAVEQHLKQFDIDYNPNREPDLAFASGWVQEKHNQQALLDCFFEQVRPEESLCFFYAKQVPFVEDAGRVRVIVGVGRVKHIGESAEYKYTKSGDLRSILWERMVQHSIRPNFQDGFLLPYHQALELAKQNPDFDPVEIAAFAPGDRIDEFSYATEDVTHDGAIAALLACAVSLQKSIQHHIPGPWEQCLQWIDARLGELWKMRGPCPGLGAALSAFGIELGTFVARDIAAQLGDSEDPWRLVDQVFKNPKAHLSPQLASPLRGRLRSSRLCQPSQKCTERRGIDKRFRRFGQTLVVFTQTPIPPKPTVGTFHDPTTWNHFEAAVNRRRLHTWTHNATTGPCIGMLDALDTPSKLLLHPTDKRGAIPAIHPQMLQARKVRLNAIEPLLCTFLVGLRLPRVP